MWKNDYKNLETYRKNMCSIAPPCVSKRDVFGKGRVIPWKINYYNFYVCCHFCEFKNVCDDVCKNNPENCNCFYKNKEKAEF